MKQYLKTILAIFMLCASMVLIISKKSINNKLAVVTKDKAELKIATGSKIIEISNNEGEEEQRTSVVKGQENSIFNISEKVDLDLADKASPNTVEKIDTKVLDDNMLIELTKPQDKGTNYEYIIKNNNDEKKMSFYAKSEIKGYSYSINNQKDDCAPIEINKIDESPIVIQKLDWEKDYYLHIRSFDKNNNFSDNKTFKLDLPSNGVTVKYIDINSNTEISKPENINGIAKETYDASELTKEIDDYLLIGNQGELNGKLKKEKINIIFKYAKKAVLNINYINQETGETVHNSKTINGYEGEDVEITALDLQGFYTDNDSYKLKMQPGTNIFNIYYTEIPKGTVNTKYLEIETNEELEESNAINDYINKKYITEPIEIEGYKLVEMPVNSSGIITDKIQDVVYYYKKVSKNELNATNELSVNTPNNNAENKKTAKVKYIDYETKKTIKTDIITSSEDKTNYIIKPIEGYKIMNKDDFNDNSIINELIQSLSNDPNFVHQIEEDGNIIIPTEANSNITSEFEIVLNCDNSDYIIYYKKQGRGSIE